MFRSLRARLLLGTVGATVVFLIAIGFALYGLVRSSLIGEFDAVLGSKARVLSIMVVEGENDSKLWYKLVYEPSYYPEYERTQDAEYFQIWRSGGQVLKRSPTLDHVDLPRLAGAVDAPAFVEVTLPDGRPGRAGGIRFTPRREDGEKRSADPKKEMTLVVAQGTEALDVRLNRFRWLLGGVFAAAIVLAGVVLGWVVTSLLYPLQSLANRIARLDADDLSARFSGAYLPSELRPVARRLDDLLRRLEAAFAREKSFTADVAHELRTPLSGLRTTLEVMLSKPREAGQYREALDECLGIGRRLQALVDNLLSLAQLEGQRAALATEPVQLDYLLRETWKLFAERATARRVQIEWRIPAPVFVDSDAVRLRIVVANLLDNAVSYVDEGGTITIAASSAAGRAELSVANTGSLVGGEDVTRIFDRFWRGDRSRAVGLHCGLGLALCQRIVALVGGTISATAEKEKVFRIAVTMPAGDVPMIDDDAAASKV